MKNTKNDEAKRTKKREKEKHKLTEKDIKSHFHFKKDISTFFIYSVVAVVVFVTLHPLDDECWY